MTAPKRFRLSRKPGLPQKPEGAVDVSRHANRDGHRTDRWGNSWAIEGDDRHGYTVVVDTRPNRRQPVPAATPPVGPFPTKVAAARYAVDRYADWLADVHLDLTDLAGKDLACWCPLDAPCHADVLLAIANPEAAR